MCVKCVLCHACSFDLWNRSKLHAVMTVWKESLGVFKAEGALCESMVMKEVHLVELFRSGS